MAMEDSQRIRNLKINARHRIDLLKCILTGAPYALYLRDFSSEQVMVHNGPGHGAIVQTRRASEESVVDALSKPIPVFSLANDRGSIYRRARSVYLLDESWLQRFQLFAREASAIIVDTDFVSSGLKREFHWIVENGALNRTLLIAESDTWKDLRAEKSAILNAKRVVERGSNLGEYFSRKGNVWIASDVVSSVMASRDREQRAVKATVVSEAPQTGASGGRSVWRTDSG